MDASKLFNCCTDCTEPDWLQFDGLEIGACVEIKEGGETYTEGGHMAADFFTVYGHLKAGGLEAITDTPTFEDALVAVSVLAEMSSLRWCSRC